MPLSQNRHWTGTPHNIRKLCTSTVRPGGASDPLDDRLMRDLTSFDKAHAPRITGVQCGTQRHTRRRSQRRPYLL